MEFKEYYLGELCEIKSSKRIYAKDYVNKGIPFYRSKEIIEKSKGLDISQNLYIDNKKFEEIEEKHGIPETGNLLLTSVGTLGVPYIVKNEKFYFKDGNLTWFTNFKSLLNQYYLFYWFKSKEGIGEINRVTIGSTQKALTIKNLRYLKITLPDKKNQFKIINLIQKIENKLENNKQVIANLEELSQTLFKRWFVDFEFPDENGNSYKSSGGEMVESELGEIPKFWKISKLEEIIDYSNKSIDVEKSLDKLDYIGLEHIPKNNKISINNWENSSKIKGKKTLVSKGDILFGKLRPYFQKIGISPINGVVSTDILVIRPKKEEFYYFLLVYISQNKFIQYTTNTATGTRMPRTGTKQINTYKLILPPVSTLELFNTTLKNITINILQKNQEIRTLEILRDTLLPKLMSGELEIPDDIEVNEDELSI